MEIFEPLAKGPIHLPPAHTNDRVVPTVVVTMIVATIIYLSSFLWANQVFPASAASADSSSSTTATTTTKEVTASRRRLCYQITNISINGFLGLMGCYFEYVLLPKNPTMEQKVQGNEDYYVFGAVQIGYQLWSLFVGTIFVDERVEMIFHHMAVITVAGMSVFFNNGFRYWTPYFFGIFELSSVPLGLMNSFKDNKAWMEAYPKVYGNLRITFAATFLTIRLLMLVPRLVYLRDCFMIPYLMDQEDFGYRMYLFMVWASSCFLFLLQLYWGYLIISGIVKKLTGGDNDKNPKAKEQ